MRSILALCSLLLALVAPSLASADIFVKDVVTAFRTATVTHQFACVLDGVPVITISANAGAWCPWGWPDVLCVSMPWVSTALGRATNLENGTVQVIVFDSIFFSDNQIKVRINATCK
jgi:hypothetical protein